MRTFVRVVELWLPDTSRTRLVFSGGIFGDYGDFRRVTEAITFGPNEGLPGTAWALRRPVILTKFENSYFRRTEAAAAAGLTCGIALPVFAGEFLMGVLVLFCGDDDEHVGAIELWHNDRRQSNEMRLVDGYFGTADMFEFNARHTKFPPGFGLPGRTWKAKSPLLVKDLHNAKSFLRWEQAQEIGINVGFGIPYEVADNDTWIVTFLSALNTPIARRIELWQRNESGDRLTFQTGYCDTGADLNAMYGASTIGKGDGAIGQAWLAGVPIVRDEDLGDDASASGRAAREAGMSKIVVLPIIRGSELSHAVAWYL